jgi:hypothetical protein
MKSQQIILATSITAIALVSAFLGASVFLHPSSADSPTTTSSLPPWGGNFSAIPVPGGGPPGIFFQSSGQLPQFAAFFPGPPANLTIGQTITLTSSSGQYTEVNDSSVNGTASGNLTFTVTGKLAEGYILSLTSGSITVGSNTYTVSSGSAQTGPSANAIEGQGTTSSSGNFIIQAQASGSFAGTSSTVRMDLSAGGIEYFVNLGTSVAS